MFLDGEQQVLLADTLATAFDSGAAFDEFLLYNLNLRREIFSGAEPLRRRAFEMVMTAERQGLTADLIIAFTRECPDQPEVQRVAAYLLPYVSGLKKSEAVHWLPMKTQPPPPPPNVSFWSKLFGSLAPGRPSRPAGAAQELDTATGADSTPTTERNEDDMVVSESPAPRRRLGLCRRHYTSGAPWEAQVGYSRAVRRGPWVFVSGTTATADDGQIVGVGDPHAQTVQAVANIRTALEALDSGLEDVVRTRIYVVDIDQWPEIARAHSEAFGEIRPATSMVEVRRLIAPEMLVEIEADAIV